MDINFYDDPNDRPVMREDVRIRDMQLEVSPEGRRVAVDFDITPFIERPSIQLFVVNASGEKAGSLTVIETLDNKFGLVIHLRDKEPTETYEIHAHVYYASLEDGTRQTVHTLKKAFSIPQ